VGTPANVGISRLNAFVLALKTPNIFNLAQFEIARLSESLMNTFELRNQQELLKMLAFPDSTHSF
jgi:hypothetical protein